MLGLRRITENDQQIWHPWQEVEFGYNIATSV